MQKLVSWNVNGLRACIQKGFLEFFKNIDADFFCIQESKLQAEQLNINISGYFSCFNFALKKGYSGTGIFAKKEPESYFLGIGIEEHDHEGRVITLEYKDFYVVTVYTPNSQRDLLRLTYRMEWEDAFLKYIITLKEKKPVIFCGDLNVAHKEIDLKNPKANRRNAGFTDEEREKFNNVLNAGFTDTYRYLYPEQKDAYTWWSYMGGARTKNVGWRIDYFCISNNISNKLKEAKIYPEIYGSDHCPVSITIDM